MSFTCAKKQYPCPVHAPGHLPVSEIVNHKCIVIWTYHRWATTEKWFCEVVEDAIQTFNTPDQDTNQQAIAAALEYLSSKNQPKPERQNEIRP